MPQEKSPVRDINGTFCGVNQAGPVWFLAGGYGTSKIHRECDIPSDKYIFFPVINVLHFPRDPYVHLTCDEVKRAASVNNQHLDSFMVEIDGQKFINPVFYRQSSSSCFDLGARTSGANKAPHAYPSATDGYWIMLKPLSIGNHKIAFHAQYNNPDTHHRMTQDIMYDVNVYVPK